MANNMIIEGDYKGAVLALKSSFSGEKLYLIKPFSKKILIDKDVLANYEVITEEHRKSALSGITRGLVGSSLLGPVGLLAGLSAKNKSDCFTILEFKDGKRSLVEIDERIYKHLIKIMF